MEQQEYIINNSKLVIAIGDIVTSQAEVLVSSDDTECSMSGGVSCAILGQGGDAIYADAQKKVPASLGDVLITTAGLLSQKFIFHCITMDAYGLGQDPGFEWQRMLNKMVRIWIISLHK